MLDVFKQDAFSTSSLIGALLRVDYLPMYLGSAGLFTPKPVATETVAIEKEAHTLSLIQTSERGAPVGELSGVKRDIRDFRTPRLAKRSRINASELSGVRQLGEEQKLQTVQDEVLKRMVRLRLDMDLTWEMHRLGAVQGILLDADGSVLKNWFTEFAITQDDEINFALTDEPPVSGAVRKLCNQVVRQTLKALKLPIAMPGMRIKGLCGDAFWDDLTAHPEVRQTYLNQAEAPQLRKGNAYGEFDYGNITFVNYRGTDDGTTVGIGSDKCKFYPEGIPDLFVVGQSPGEFMDTVNTLGQPLYPRIVTDKDLNAWADTYLFSYPLHICTNPKVLQRARRN